MSRLIQGRQRDPFNAFIYGPPGQGKTSFLYGAPGLICVGPEENGELDALKLKCSTSAEFLGDIQDIANGKYDKYKLQTVGVDSIDMVQGLIFKRITDSEPGKTMETARKAYGKAYAEARMDIVKIREVLKTIRDNKKLNIVVLGHARKVKFNDPILALEYDVWEPTLHKGKNDDWNQIFMEWASAVFFINSKSFKEAGDDAKYAFSMGKRELLTEFRPSQYAKNRWNLPYSIELDTNLYQNWSKVMNMVDKFYSSGAIHNNKAQELAAIAHNVKELLVQVKDEATRPLVEKAFLDNQNSFENLAVIRDRLREIISNQ